MARLTYSDSGGSVRLKAWALPVAAAAIAVPIVLAMLVGMLTIEGTALGLVAGAAAVATILVIAARQKPRPTLEVAAHADEGRRLVVVATEEATPEAAERIAQLADDPDDVRLVIPIPSARLDRWLSGDDPARAEAQRRLAHSAGALVAAGLPVSGSLGDSDPAQALEDELHSYPADEVILLAPEDADDPLAEAEGRLELPLHRIRV
jgi:hypothetical protein